MTSRPLYYPDCRFCVRGDILRMLLCGERVIKESRPIVELVFLLQAGYSGNRSQLLFAAILHGSAFSHAAPPVRPSRLRKRRANTRPLGKMKFRIYPKKNTCTHDTCSTNAHCQVAALTRRARRRACSPQASP